MILQGYINMDARQNPASDSTTYINAKYTSPFRLVGIMVGGIFIAEVIAMGVMYVLNPRPYWVETLLDATIMTIMIFPVLYYFSFRPLVLQIRERERVELQMEQQNRELRKLSEAEHNQRQLAEAMAAENQHLYAAELHARQVSETLSAVTMALTQSLDLDTVMETLLEHICRLEMCDKAYIAIVEDETHLTLRAMLGFDAETHPKQSVNSSFDTAQVAYLQEVITTQKRLLIPDTRQYPGWITLISRGDVLSWLGIPILVNDRVIGVLVMAKSTAEFFTDQHMRLAELIVGQASVAIQNAWLFEQVRSGHERLQSLSVRLVEVQESERRFIARELHDDTSQALTALMFGLQLLANDAGQPESVVARAAELKILTNDVLENLHRLAMNLRPASLDHLGLVVALEQLVQGMGERYGLNIHYKTGGFSSDHQELPDYMETTLYRIAQEALTNVVRHAQALNVDVILEQRDDRVVVVVEDDGVGFDPAGARPDHHLGLLGMQERAQIVGGIFRVESKPGSGTTLVAEVPYAHTYFDRG